MSFKIVSFRVILILILSKRKVANSIFVAQEQKLLVFVKTFYYIRGE